MQRRRYATAADRIRLNVAVDENGCWIWQLTRTHDGYGRLSVPGGRPRIRSAHRFSYEALVGPIPEGLTLDHICRVRACVNPAHLEPVTQAVNSLRSAQTLPGGNVRKTHCPRGHAYDGANTLVIPSRPHARYCRACARIRRNAARAAA